jgi:hypothetical protein
VTFSPNRSAYQTFAARRSETTTGTLATHGVAARLAAGVFARAFGFVRDFELFFGIERAPVGASARRR